MMTPVAPLGNVDEVTFMSAGVVGMARTELPEELNFRCGGGPHRRQRRLGDQPWRRVYLAAEASGCAP